jgi:hypothetical protein
MYIHTYIHTYIYMYVCICAAGDNSLLTVEGSLVNVSRGGSELHELVRAGDVEGIKALQSSSAPAVWERALCSLEESTDDAKVGVGVFFSCSVLS